MGDRRFAYRVVSTLESERGASFILALLLILVCVALTSAVLAAVSASTGRFANQSEVDQRYYAVTSAAQLFRDSLGNDDELTVVFTQEGVATRPAGAAAPLTWDSVKFLNERTGTVDPQDSSSDPARGYSFLPVLTYYALFGTDQDTTSERLWADPFMHKGWNGGTEHEHTVTFAVTPASTGGMQTYAGSVDVDVVAHLKDDWTLELDFSNAQDADKFHLTMALTGNLEQRTLSSEVEGAKTTEVRQTSVTWRVQRIVAGEEVADD